MKIGGIHYLTEPVLVLSSHAKWTLPTLVLHGDQDKLADVEGSRHFAGAISSTDKTYREVAGGYHELFNDIERDDTTRELLHWLDARV